MVYKYLPPQVLSRTLSGYPPPGPDSGRLKVQTGREELKRFSWRLPKYGVAEHTDCLKRPCTDMS